MAGAEMGDGLSAVAFRLGGDGAAADDDEVGRRTVVERDDGMSLCEEAGFLVKRLRAVQAAAECQERDFNARIMIA